MSSDEFPAEESVQSTWTQDDYGTKIIVEMGEVTITVESSYEQASRVPVLVAALPEALNRTWDVILGEDGEA